MTRLLGLAVLAVSVFAGPATANCVGTQNTVTACHANREVYRDCVYAGPPPCRPLVVRAPLCVYGTIGSHGQFVTAWC